MKKRIGSMLLCAVLALSLIPVPVQAVGTWFVELTQEKLGSVFDAGYYYLADDLSLTGDFRVKPGQYDGWAQLDLNGHTLTIEGENYFGADHGGELKILV